jgi:hypothetical protein
MIVNLNKIIPRSLSEEKGRAKHNNPLNKLLISKMKNCEQEDSPIEKFKFRENDKLLKQKDFILGHNKINSELVNESITHEYDPMKETACFKFIKSEDSELPSIIKQNKDDLIALQNCTLEEENLIKQVLDQPASPHQNGTFDNRTNHDRKALFSENQLQRRHHFGLEDNRKPVINPINMKYKERIFFHNDPRAYNRHIGDID